MIGRAAVWLKSLWWNIARRDQVEAALDDELRTYVDLLAAENERKGMTPANARRAALVATGGVEQVKEATRDAWVGGALATARRELTYALRTLRRSPGFLVVAVVTLAVGIGGATAVFTVIKGSLLRPLPAVPAPHELVSVIGLQNTRIIDDYSYAEYRDLRAGTTALNGLAAYNGMSSALGERGSLTRVWVSFVSDNFFSVLDVRPVIGRMFDSTTNAATDGAVAVIGHALWQKEFGGSPHVIGSTTKLNGHVFTIVGVAPPGFIGAMALNRMEVWIPVATRSGQALPIFGNLDLSSRREVLFWLVGRLAPNKSIDDAQRELELKATQLAAAFPETNAERTVRVVRGAGMTPGERAQLARVPRLLAMAVALLLFIACGNVAGLFLVRAAARRRELATRLALGASRVALVRQVALEGALIALGSAVLGVVIARLLVRSATLVRTVVSMQDLDLAMDRRVLGVAILAAALTAVAVSLAPAFQILRVSPSAVLKDGGGAGRRRKTQSALVCAQVGASLVLLYAATLVFTTFQRVLITHSSFDPANISDFSLDTQGPNLDTASRLVVYREVLRRVAAEPGVRSVTLSNVILPFQWSAGSRVYRRGEEPPPGPRPSQELDAAFRATAAVVSPSFFETTGISLLHGRGFDAGDRLGSTPVVIISRAIGEALWPGQDAVGRFVAWPPLQGPARPPLLIIGIAQDVSRISADAPRVPVMYLPFTQQPNHNLGLLVRGTNGVSIDVATLRRIVAGIDARIYGSGGRTLADRLGVAVRPQRMTSAWLGAFGVISLLLAGIGVYGVVAQGVLQRTRELAVRGALGASPRQILTLVLGDGVRLAAIGAIVGLIGAVAAWRTVRSMFSDVSGVDPRLALAAALVLGVAILAATYLPARRAARLSPAEVLRSD